MAPRNTHPDGRTARRLENRLRIVDATFALLKAGQQPTLAQIAQAAGVTSRTLLNHFPDVASLVTAALARATELAELDLPELPSAGRPELRIRHFCQRAATFYDTYAVIRWTTLTRAHGLQGFAPRQGKKPLLHELERRVSSLLRGAGLDLDGDAELRRAARVMTDPLAWRLLRVQQGLTRKAAADAMAAGLVALGRGTQHARR